MAKLSLIAAAIAISIISAACGRGQPASTTLSPQEVVALADPCNFLTAGLRLQFSAAGGVQESDPNSGGRTCKWNSDAHGLENSFYLVRVLDSRIPGENSTESIRTYPTYEYISPNAKLDYYCIYTIDIHPQLTLWTEYDTTIASHDSACTQNKKFADAVVDRVVSLTE